MDRSPKGHAFLAYATNYLIDLDHAVIVDVEASRAIRQAEVGSARTMLDRTQERFGLWPARLAADSAYARPRTSPGWSMSVGSSRISRCSTNPSAAMAPSAAPTSPTTTPRISTLTRKEVHQYRRRFGISREGVDPEGFMRYRAPACAAEVAVEARGMAGLMDEFVAERGVVAFGGDEAGEGWLLDVVMAGAVIGPCAAMADVGCGRRDEGLGPGIARDVGDGCWRLRDEPVRQPVDLIGVEDGIGFEERDAALDLGPGRVIGLGPVERPSSSRTRLRNQ